MILSFSLYNLNFVLSCNKIFNCVKELFNRYFELAFWIASLVVLSLMNPSTDAHYSLCFFKLLGLDFCPGCGLGHSISFLFHGNLQASVSAHPLGIFALTIILFRIYKLASLQIFNYTKTHPNAYRQWL